ncbi:hypothetical protein [Rhizobium giardinii]|uniref:hypothetical protein n=1 Tax=Rhizobium giardinii TaxID=56731 RepID=UPI003D6F0891
MRELETICEFLTGQGLFSGLDFIFTFVFIAALFAYSATLAWIVIASIPLYIAIAFLIRTFLKERIDEKFDRSVNRAGFTGRLPAAPLVGEVATSRVKVHRPLAHGQFLFSSATGPSWTPVIDPPVGIDDLNAARSIDRAGCRSRSNGPARRPARNSRVAHWR